MNGTTLLITQSGILTFTEWWWVMRVEGCSVVVRGSSDCSPPQVLVVAELDAETEASALFELINERIALGTKLFDVRASTTPVSRAAARYQKGR